MIPDSTPETESLVKGYRRFRETGWAAHRQRWSELSEGQSPKVMVVACSDSRTDPAQIFDVDPGEIFVVRNIAALIPPFETSPGRHGVSAALEFAVQVLDVNEIVVMGHGMCGGCETALIQSMKGAAPGEGGFIAEWIGMLSEARERVAAKEGTQGSAARRMMEQEAVKVSLANLRTFPCVRVNEAKGSLSLRGAYFSISDGILHLLDSESGKFRAIV